MTERVDIVPADDGMLAIIAENMRQQDIEECLALGFSPLEDLKNGMAEDDFTMIVFCDDIPCFVFGGRQRESGNFLWGLSTEECERRKREMLVLGREIVRVYLDIAPAWFGFVAAEYERSVRWLERIGFNVGEVEGINGAKLRRITLRRT